MPNCLGVRHVPIVGAVRKTTRSRKKKKRDRLIITTLLLRITSPQVSDAPPAHPFRLINQPHVLEVHCKATSASQSFELRSIPSSVNIPQTVRCNGTAYVIVAEIGPTHNTRVTKVLKGSYSRERDPSSHWSAYTRAHKSTTLDVGFPFVLFFFFFVTICFPLVNTHVLKTRRCTMGRDFRFKRNTRKVRADSNRTGAKVRF